MKKIIFIIEKIKKIPQVPSYGLNDMMHGAAGHLR